MLGLEHDSFTKALRLGGHPSIDLSAEEMPVLLHVPMSSCGFDLSSEGIQALPHDPCNPAPLSVAFPPLVGLLNRKTPALPHGPVRS
jgi:hypothetical protein